MGPLKIQKYSFHITTQNNRSITQVSTEPVKMFWFSSQGIKSIFPLTRLIRLELQGVSFMDGKYSGLQQYVAECKQDINAKFRATLQFKLSLQPHYL